MLHRRNSPNGSSSHFLRVRSQVKHLTPPFGKRRSGLLTALPVGPMMEFLRKSVLLNLVLPGAASIWNDNGLGQLMSLCGTRQGKFHLFGCGKVLVAERAPVPEGSLSMCSSYDQWETIRIPALLLFFLSHHFCSSKCRDRSK